MKHCCEIVENGYMDCNKCYEADNIRKNLSSDLYQKWSKGELLSIEEIELLKIEIEDVRKNLNTL